MDPAKTPDAYGALIEPTTLRIQRLLPGPIERIWAELIRPEDWPLWWRAVRKVDKIGDGDRDGNDREHEHGDLNPSSHDP